MKKKTSTSLRSQGHNVDIPRRNRADEVIVRVNPEEIDEAPESAVPVRPPKRKVSQDSEGYTRVFHRRQQRRDPEEEDRDFQPEVPARRPKSKVHPSLSSQGIASQLDQHPSDQEGANEANVEGDISDDAPSQAAQATGSARFKPFTASSTEFKLTCFRPDDRPESR